MSDLPSWARVGTRVVCVDDDPEGDCGVFPVMGEIYTIRETIRFEGVWCAHLREIQRPASKQTGRVVPYRLSRFRPLVETKSDDEVEARLYHKKGLHQSAPRRKSVEA